MASTFTFISITPITVRDHPARLTHRFPAQPLLAHFGFTSRAI
jgi:hypothetical protein